MSLRQRDQSGSDFSEVSEECGECDRETVHEVSVEIRTENPDSTFSREPYRIAECNVCGGTEEVRLNNA
jgi:hypothetical protein